MPKFANLKIDPNVLRGVTAYDLIEMISKYPVVTRKMLLIAPKRPGENLEALMNAAADAMKTAATALKWTVIDLRGNAATRDAILKSLKDDDPDFVAYFGHSLGSNIPGQKNDTLEVAISGSNAKVLSGRTACITACSTVTPVGIPAVKAKCVAYMGYTGLFNAVFSVNSATNKIILTTELCKDWIKGTNGVYQALLNGATYATARKKGRKAWDDIWLKWTAKRATNPSIPAFVPGSALENRDRLDFVGAGNGVARPIGLLVAA